MEAGKQDSWQVVVVVVERPNGIGRRGTPEDILIYMDRPEE